MEEDSTLGRIGGFRLVRRLATGGTSDVLLARAEGPHGFERTVVLKRLLTEHQSDPNFARMFAREAAAYARLSHPAIVRLFDFFTANGQLVMVLEYVDGTSLAKLMTYAAQSGQRLDDRVCFFIAARIFDALSAAHDARNPDTAEPTPVIHRDVNPSNVLIPWDGHAKLADFGIAKIGDIDGETQKGLIKGTFGYMAPEQVKGERVTIRTDVYAATLVLWELLSRRKAIQADKLPEMEILRAMAEPNLPTIDVMRPDLHESIREAVNRGLEPNAAKRSITAEEMMGLLRAHFDAEDARSRLAQAMQPLKSGAVPPSRPMGDTMSDAGAPPSVSRPSVADKGSTLPIPTRPAPFPVPRPSTPSQVATAVQMQPAAAASTKRDTPSGFRAVAPPAAPPVAPPAPITVPIPVYSEPSTVQTTPPPQAALQAVSAPPPMQPPLQPMPPAFTPPPFAAPPFPAQQASMAPPAKRSYGWVIALGAVAAVVVLGLAAVAIVAARFQFETSPTPAVTTHAVATATQPSAKATETPSATVTATVTVTVTASASAPASASATPTASATVSATATASTPPTPSASSTDSAAVPIPTPGPDESVLIFPAYARDHRIFVDGKVKGEGSAPLVTACGQHTVQIGSSGKPRDMNLPCGALARIE